MIWHQIVVSIWNFGGVPLYSLLRWGAGDSECSAPGPHGRRVRAELQWTWRRTTEGVPWWHNQGDPFPPNPDIFNTKRNRFNTMFSVFTCLCLAELFEKAMEMYAIINSSFRAKKGIKALITISWPCLTPSWEYILQAIQGLGGDD